jgi:hypothetical protein
VTKVREVDKYNPSKCLGRKEGELEILVSTNVHPDTLCMKNKVEVVRKGGNWAIPEDPHC